MINRIHLAAAALLALGLLPASGRASDSASQPTSSPTTEPSAPIKIHLAEFEKKQKEPDTVVLDVRTPKEFAAGHVPGAVNIDWHSRQFNDRVSALDKSKTYLVHCAGGVRSAAAVQRMQSLQFNSLFDYTGGFMEYEKSGEPIEK